MQNLKGESTVEPKTKIIGKNSVDINTNISQVTKKTGRGTNAKTETIYAYDVTRYTLQEYIEKLSDDSTTTNIAVAELSDLVLTKEG
jgi:hypothetical protein